MTPDVRLVAELLEDSTDALALIDPESLMYVYFSEGVVRMLGVDRATLEREGAVAGQAAAYGAADAEALRRRYAAAIAAYPHAVVGNEELLRVGGGRITAERSTRAIEWQGRWLIASRLSDVTDRKAAQESAERLRFAADHAGDAIVLIDYQTLRYIEANQRAADMFGYTKAELLEMGPGKVTQLGNERLREIYKAIIESPSQLAMGEVEFPHADGRLFYTEVTRRAVLSEGRWVIVACIRDVTRRKKAEDALALRLVELQRSNEELERFAYVVSHDLTEPLRMVSSYVQLLQRRYHSLLDQDGREFVQFAVDGTRRMNTLLEDLLVYSRAGRTLKPPGEQDLQAVMRDVTSNLEILIRETGATVEAPASATVRADRTSLIQVLQNLVANAIKFTPQGKRPVVRVTCDEDRKGWTVSVADNGLGIEPQYFDRIFIVFQRLHARGEYAGNGIGLAVCKKIVERYGGRIWVESAPGAGATFRFTLPRVEL